MPLPTRHPFTKIVRACGSLFGYQAAFARRRTYGVVCLLEDRFTLVHGRARDGGTYGDPNRYDAVAVDPLAFSGFIERAVRSALGRTDETAELVWIKHAGHAARSACQANAGNIDEVARLIAFAALPSTNAQPERIIIVAPLFTDLRLRMGKARLGSGKAAGFGFYVNRFTPTRRDDTGERARGYFGVFANLRLVMINPATGSVLMQEMLTAGWALSAAHAADGNPWNALPGDRKMVLAEKLAAREIRRLLLARMPSEPDSAPLVRRDV